MTKPVLIMIHGFRGTHHGLQPIANHLRGFTLHIPDLPGFGKGDTLPEYTLDAYISWLHSYIQKVSGTQKPILLGHSFGSIVAAAYAAQYPDTIEQLILVNPIGAPALEGPRGILTKLALGYYHVGRLLPKNIGKKWLSSRTVVMIMSVTMAKTKDKALRAFIHSEHKAHFSTFHDATSVTQGFQTSVSHDVSQFAAAITVPTLLIVGDQDDITPLTKQKLLHRSMKDAELFVIENAGHLTHYETPDQVASAIQDFTKRR